MRYFLFLAFGFSALIARAQQPAMNDMWKGQASNKKIDTMRGKVFREGRYAMFIHFGYYSELSNQWKGKTYYGIGEWLMNENMAHIPADEYKAGIKNFNPKNFNADSIVATAKQAGMKYIVITSKHHDGFAMFHSKYSRFNIVDATPFGRDIMKEMAIACKKADIGLGFYYSQTQDWTTPGGYGGPEKDEAGKKVSFDEYFLKRCLPEVEQLTTQYGDIVLVWFDTPANIEKKYVEKLVETVHKNQPKAFVSGRVGHNLGDYTTLGDMQVAKKNTSGLWETVDVTNDSWGYAWYDNNWKTPKQILTNTLTTIARGGNYMLNVGPNGKGEILHPAKLALLSSGKWIKRYPQLIYKGGPSPWQHALPWGDAITNGNKVSLLMYNWPTTGRLYVPGLQSRITAIQLLNNGKKLSLKYKKQQNWLLIDIPNKSPEQLVSVIEITLQDAPKADETLGVDPQQATTLDALFASTDKCEKNTRQWMEKFGEWKHADVISQWKENGKAMWTVDVLQPGYYQSSLSYAGKGKLVWKIAQSENNFIQNQQGATEAFAWYPIGWIRFDKPGRYTISVSLEEGNKENLALTGLKLEHVIL